MLFAYTYVPHQMEKMQEFIDFIFYEVWCNAPSKGDFRLELFDDNAELKELMKVFYYGDTEYGDFFYGHVERIYGLFDLLDHTQIDQLTQWYKGNNDIERACANDPAVQIARYADIKVHFPDLEKQLAAFFKGLYSHLGNAPLRDKIGQISDHYRAFVQINRTGKCPFCGLIDIKGEHHSKREAYDHYLPKWLYPFNSINFRNLAPTCHECNSAYKGTKDPTYSSSGRRKAFYPYAASGHAIEITIDLDTPDVDRLEPADIHLTFGPAAVQEEIATWRDVYGIDERYKAKCCGNDAMIWLEQIRIQCDTLNNDPADFLATLQQLNIKDPVADNNFLKIAFLEGCERAGLFDAIAK